VNPEDLKRSPENEDKKKVEVEKNLNRLENLLRGVFVEEVQT